MENFFKDMTAMLDLQRLTKDDTSYEVLFQAIQNAAQPFTLLIHTANLLIPSQDYHSSNHPPTSQISHRSPIISHTSHPAFRNHFPVPHSSP